MQPPLRILDTGLAPARWNVATTAALVEACAQRSATTMLGAAVVRFHRYPACVLLGSSQDATAVADLDYCRSMDIAIARRVTGGGAVYMSPGMLAWDVLVDRRQHGGELGAVTERIGGGVAAGLSRLGVAARFRPPNDIEINGRKVSGTAGYVAGRIAVLQGTVLIADDVPVMARALRLPEAALRGRVTCLVAETGTAPALPAVVDCIAMGLAEALDCVPAPDRLHDDELSLCEALLREETGTDGSKLEESGPCRAS